MKEFFISKMAGLNITLNVNGRQSSSDKKHNISLRLVLFFPFAVVLPALYSFFIDSETNERFPLQSPRCFSLF